MSLFTSTKQSGMVLECDKGLLYEVLTDYDNLAEWLPQIGRSKLLAKEGDLALAEFEATLPGRERFVIEGIHTKDRMVLWRAIGGNPPVSQVEWTITSAGEGHSQVTLTLTRNINWKSFRPKYSVFLKPATYLKAFEHQISAFLPEIAVTDEDGEKILELSETDQGVVCWIRGRKYVLAPESEEAHDQRGH